MNYKQALLFFTTFVLLPVSPALPLTWSPVFLLPIPCLTLYHATADRLPTNVRHGPSHPPPSLLTFTFFFPYPRTQLATPVAAFVAAGACSSSPANSASRRPPMTCLPSTAVTGHHQPPSCLPTSLIDRNIEYLGT